jgi:hypothetical protein
MQIIVASACAVVVASPTLWAQASTDTTAAFREGQWGVGFVQGRSLTEAGVLRFGTPTLAWVADGWATFDQQVLPGGGVFGADASTQTTTINLAVGPRWYHGQSARLARFAGFGITGGYLKNKSSATENRDRTWSVGGYAEIGVQYMFTRHFGLGWRGDLLGSRIADRSTLRTGTGGDIDQESTFYHVTLEPVQVMGTIYF